ncbi:hypothetical protein GCM10022221_23320 [Actinocorallia aurea]
MSRNYHSIAFTEPVLKAQEQYGSRTALHRAERRLAGRGSSGAAVTDGTDPAPSGGPDQAGDPLGHDEQDFITGRDGFYLATVAADGRPYVQFRGGPPGFVTAPDAHTLAWADFRGNRQYISTGNMVHDPRVSLIFVDYARRLRLKLFGVATITDVRGEGPSASASAVSGYRAVVEREVRIEVTAFDWNCPQHITPRYTAEELAPVLRPLRDRIEALQAENDLLRGLLAAAQNPTSGSSKPERAEEDR